MNKTLSRAIFFVVILSLAVILQLPEAHSSQVLDVHVNNFPDTQQIKGAVSIEGTMSHSKYIKKEGIVVPTSRRSELSELIPAGIIETDGFTFISLSMQGEIKSASFTSGTIGVLLIPDEEPIVRALREAKRIQFPIESVSRVSSGDPSFFSADQSQQRVVFPRYRIYLYNTTNRSLEANVYLYLSN
jgi:hypothetical protein